MEKEIEFNVKLTLEQVRTLEGLVSNEWEVIEAESIKDLKQIRVLGDLVDILHPLCLYGTPVEEFNKARVKQ